MKTKLFLLLGMCSVMSCTNDLEQQQVTEDITNVVITAKDFQLDKQSRTNLEITNQGAKFTWAANDTIGIFPNEGAQAYFPMTSGTGSKTATFSGGGWALKPSSTYAAYYPMQGKFYLDKTKIPVNYEGQTQVGNASTAHLGKYDFMAAVAKTPENGNVNFNFEHLGALVELNITLPKAGTYKSVTLHCNDAFLPSLKGYVNITSAKPEIVAVDILQTEQMTIHLNNFVTTKENETVKVYFMIPPVDFTGHEIGVFVLGSTDYYGLVNMGNLSAGFAYSLNVTDDPTPPSEWVDLGLPSGILWAARNVGAAYPEDYGDYFAWGETKPKDVYNEGNSLTYDKPWFDISGNPQYDAATANWGAPARMPTESEVDELINECTTTWTSQYEVNGRLVTGPNGNSIFLPAAGLLYWSMLDQAEAYAYYLSSTPQKSFNSDAYNLSFSRGYFSAGWIYRYYGLVVRPVRDK